MQCLRRDSRNLAGPLDHDTREVNRTTSALSAAPATPTERALLCFRVNPLPKYRHHESCDRSQNGARFRIGGGEPSNRPSYGRIKAAARGLIGRSKDQRLRAMYFLIRSLHFCRTAANSKFVAHRMRTEDRRWRFLRCDC